MYKLKHIKSGQIKQYSIKGTEYKTLLKSKSWEEFPKKKRGRPKKEVDIDGDN